MLTAVQIPSALALTLDQARDRLVAELGPYRLPTAWHSREAGDDCLAFLLWALGVRQADDFETALVSIRAFRAVAGWHEVSAAEVRPGDLVLWDWEEDDDVDHVEFCYSVDRVEGTITTVSANTGPRPGVELTAANRGVYRKTRPISGEISGGIRPPYRPPATVATSADRKAVRIEASFLNATVTHSFEGRTILRSAAGTIIGHVPHGDGIRGPLFWILVQVWGRLHGLYGHAFKIDGIPGPQSRRVEAEILRRAKAAGYAKAA